MPGISSFVSVCPVCFSARRFILTAACLTFCGAQPLRAQVTVEVMAMADNFAPSPLRDISPAATRGGHFAQRGFTGMGGSNHHIVIWRDGAVAVRGARYDSALSPGDDAPGTSSTFNGFIPDKIFVNASGQIAFTGNTDDNQNFGFWAGQPGSLQLVARHGSPAPGTNGNFSIGYPGNTFGELRAYNDAGQVVFNAGIEGAPQASNSGLWAGSPGALQLVARMGSQAPGFAAGVTWDYLFAPQINSAGQVGVFGRVTQDPPADSLLSDGYVLMVGQPGALQIVAKAGDPAPGAEPHTVLRLSDDDFCLNAAGQVAFVSDIWSDRFGITPGSKGIFVAGGGSAGVKMVIRGGDAAPYAGVDAVFGGAYDEPLLNASGELAFVGGVSSPSLASGEGVWTGRPGQLRKVTMTNDIAPGTGGQLFGRFQDMGLLLSDSGQVAFRATYSPSGGIYGNGATTALFATDKAGTLHLIAREGAAIGSGPVLQFFDLTGASGVFGGEGSLDSKRNSMDRDGRFIFHAAGHYQNPSTGNTQYQQFVYRAVFPEAAPVIPPSGQPRGVRGVPGGSAVFEVTALGSRPANYQWKHDGENIPGANSATLTLDPLTTANRGAYTLVVTNAQGTATSTAAQLSFPPVIARQPQDLQINAGATATLSVVASGPGTLGYQWQFKAAAAADFTDVSGAAAATLTLSNIAAAQGGRYRVAVTNADGGTISREAVLTVAGAGAPLVRRLVIPGDPITGLANQLAFASAERATINNYGEIAFLGRVADDTSGGSSGSYFRSADGQYRFVTWQGYNVNLSDSGSLAQLNSRPVTTIEQGTPENMQALARRATDAPDGAGQYTNDGDFALADDGITAYRFGTHLGSAVFIGRPGATKALAFTGMAAPGLAAGMEFDVVLNPVISPSGTAAFFATLRGAGITADNDTSLWKGTASGVERIVSEADPVPAAGSGVRVGDIGFPDYRQTDLGWNESGQLAFATTLAGTGVTIANDRAILGGTPGDLQVVAREGLSNGHTFDFSSASSGPFPIVNRTGQVAFVAMVTPTGTSDFLESLWLWKPGTGGGTRQLIAREGQQAPGLPAGVVFDSTEIGKPFFTCALNGSGQIAFTTYLAGPGVSYDVNDTALYLTTPSGEAKLVVRKGSPVDIGGGETRELGDLFGMALRSGGEDGRRRSLNEFGELVFPALLKKTGTLALDYSIMMARLAPDTAAFTAAYNTWAATAFPAGSGSAVTGPTADPDQDGTPNAIEYLMATGPLTPGAAALSVQALPNGIRLTFPRRAGVPEGFETVETSPDLSSSWEPVGRAAITVTNHGTNQPQTVTVELPAGEDQRFVRVRAVAY